MNASAGGTDLNVTSNSDGTWTIEDDGSVNASNATITVSGEVTATAESVSSDVTDSFDFNFTDSAAADGSASANVTVQNAGSGSQAGSPDLLSATHYDTDASSGVQDTVVEVSFNEEIQNASEMTLYVEDEAVGLSDSAFTQTTDGRVLIDTGSDLNTGDVTLNVPDSVTDTEGNPVRASDLDDDNNVSVTVATVSINSDTGVSNPANVYQGENVAVLGNGTNTNVEVEGDDSNYAFSGSTGANSEVFVFNTTNREIDQYNFSIGQGSPNAAIEVRDLGFNMTIDDQNVTTEDSIEGTITANAGNRPIEVSLLDSDGDEVEEIGATLSGQGEYNFEFDLNDVDTGDYTVEARDNNSGVTDSSSTINVAEAGEGQANFENSIITDARGDVVGMNITMSNSDYATVTIGSEDVGFVSNVTVEDGNDDGVVRLYFNTWAAQNGETDDASDVYSVESDDDEITSSSIGTGVESLLDNGEYDLEVRSGQDASVSSQNVATLVLEQRETRSLNTWTAPSGESFSDKEELYEAAQNNNLTQAQDIAFGDRVVQQVNASGLEGVLEAQDSDEVGSQFYGATQFNYSVEQTEAGANREPFQLALNNSNSNVIADSQNDTYYITYNPSQVTAYVDENEDGQFNASEDTVVNDRLDDEEALTGNFTVLEDGLADEEQSVESDYQFSTAEYNMDEPVNVTATSNQTIEGTTTLAPGTELQLRVRSSDDTSPSFLKTSTVYVTENRTFSGTFDFSEQSANDTFTVTVSSNHPEADNLEVDGNVVEGGAEQNQTETGTAGTETETTVTETTTAGGQTTTAATTTAGGETTTAEGGNGGGGETGTGTPGFGIAVAVVALLAAALLAVRRD
ncbi:DUF7827 domain-containing protein [Halopelagius longus]|uniref:DUF7827 domain-containing protein n=1 Tax=Halopelagius longus TaxID=1236180 RepID=UPI0015870688|nr:BGTF surface domain-containing protein [Halopelagius longus]